MNGFTAFFKKENMDYLRNYKALILIGIFVIFGMMSPLTAKMMPDIFAHMNIAVSVPKPTALDAYGQFFKNFSQMGIAVLLLVFGGLLSQELSRGTLIILLAKGLPRMVVILAKYSAALVLWTVGYGLAAIVQYGYTRFLFDKPVAPHLLFSLFCLWLFGAFILAMLMMFSTMISGAYGGLFLTAVLLGALLVVQIIPKADRVSPLTLASNNVGVMTGTVNLGHVTTVCWLTLSTILVSLTIAWAVFRKKGL